MTILGFVSIKNTNTLAELNNKLYEHPYAVSNATKIIQVNIVSMQRYMKDVASAENVDDLNKAKQKVDANQKIVFEQFDIIFDKYLGNKEDIKKIYDSFVKWELIRDEVILLIKNNKQKEAYKITKGKGAEYIVNLDKEINELVIFANNKANTFHQEAIIAGTEAEKTITTLMIIISLLAFSIFSFLVKIIFDKDKKIKKYFHLIDENIMNVMLNTKYKITDASSALARFMKMSKEELLETDEYFLLDECTPEERLEISNTMQNGNIWKGEIKKTIDGETKWLEFSLHPNVLSEVRYTNILHDITDKKEFERLSKIDALTNIYNRGYFNKIFPAMIKLSQRHEVFLAFAMIDIDFFKQYNDIYGHQKGDEALKKVSKILKNSINRSDDYVFRLGGEEFGILCIINKEKDALPFMENILRNIEALKIEHSGNEISKFLTISMGLYIINDTHNCTINELYKKTDELLYKAKQNGRNNIQM